MKGFLVLSGEGEPFFLPSMFQLYKFSQVHGYNFRQILVGLSYEGQWVGYNHQIEVRQ